MEAINLQMKGSDKIMGFIYVYSTGPVENTIGGGATPGASETVYAKALNNSNCKRARVIIRLYRLNGHKKLVATRTLSLAPLSSGFAVLDVAELVQYEVRFVTFSKKVLVSAWGKDAEGNLVAAQRFTQAELHKTVKKAHKKHCK